MKVILTISKILGIISSLSSYAGLLPQKFMPIGLLLLGVASTLKDTIAWIGDYFDDGQINKSFTTEEKK